MKIHRFIQFHVTRVITNTLLFVAFVIGVGPVAIIYWITKSKPLVSMIGKTSWETPSKHTNLYKMY